MGTKDNRVKEHKVRNEVAPGKHTETTVRGTDADLAKFLDAGDNRVGLRGVESTATND